MCEIFRRSPALDDARRAAIELLEGSVLRRWLTRSRAGFLAACSLPFFAVSLFFAGLGYGRSVVSRRFWRRRLGGGEGARLKWSANQFDFERAIEAYEEVIDTAARGRR